MSRAERGMCDVSARKAILATLFGAVAFCGIAFGQVSGPSQMNQCDQQTFTIALENTSPTQAACDIVISAAPPQPGFSFGDGTAAVTVPGFPSPFAADPVGNAWDMDAIVGSEYELPPGEQISVSFDLATDCTAESGNIEVQIDYEDCQTAQPYQELDSLSIEVLPGALVVSKTPSVQDARVGEDVTWAITVESTGLGTISDVMLTDVLGAGLAYVSDTGGGTNVGQTTTWDLGAIAAGDSVSVDLTAEVISCSGLVNDADASWGCDGPPSTCFDTAIDGGTATASLHLIVDNPDLAFTPPDVAVAYCTDETASLAQITNSGAGTARNVELCCEFQHLAVDPTRLPPGTTYSEGCFSIPDIAPSTTFDLAFYVLHPGIDWCAGGPSGANTFQLTYANDCGIPFVAYPQFSTLSSGSGPALDVTKTGPASLRLGEIGDYHITVDYAGDLSCYSGSPGPVAIVDTYPDGFTVADAAGGTVDGGARTITWPNVTPPFDETVRLEAPTDCGYCAQPGGGTDANSVTATATDCCGCSISGQASAETTILCEGFGDDVAYFSSSMSLDRTTTVRCSADYAVEVTHTYTFSNDLALNDFLLNEFTYFVNGTGDLQYSAGSASVTGATLGTIVDNTPAGRLELPLTDATSVSGKVITYTYTLIVLGLDDPSCQATSYPIYAGIELDPGATSIGTCGTMYADPPASSATAQPPAMSVSIDGIPTIQEYCATYDATITLTKTSALADPYDARLVLTNAGGSLIDLSSALCTGVSPTDGTTCAAPIIAADTYEWRFADGFVAGDTVTIGPIQVTVPCSGPLADLSVVAMFDDLCHDDGVYGDACSTSGFDEASLSLTADVYTRKSPEILYATTKDVTWSLVVHNTGNGTAYNVWVDDVLGSGLIFDAANTLPDGAAVSANQDHTGAPINGATFLFDEVGPGVLKTITFAAELVACDGLTNDIAVSWGCGGSDCQAPRTDNSSVVVPPVNMVATSYAPTPHDVCTTSTANVTAKNAGVGTVYNVTANVSLPTGLEYSGNPEYRTYVFGDTPGAWLPAGEPSGVPGPNLVWTSTEIGDLASIDPAVVIEIQFDVSVGCDFPGGNLLFQTGYESPCGEPLSSSVGSFSMSARIPDVSVEMVQAPDDAIPCGASATWTITVRNDGPVPAPYVRVVSTLDAGWTYVLSTGGGSNVGQITTWEVADLGPSASTVLTITADSQAAGGGNCDDLNHQVQAFWACDEIDTQCLSSAADTGSVVGARTPPVTVGASLAPDSVEVCTDTTTFTLTVTNGSATAPASFVDARVTLPAGLSYVLGTTGIDCGAGFVSSPDPAIDGQQLTWYDTTADGGPNDACSTLAAAGQIQVRFDVASSCYFTAGSANSRIFYYDCCGITQVQQSRNDTIGSDQPNLTITKTTADAPTCGETATWTIEVTNTSSRAIAEVVRIEDFLGANLSYVSATGGAVALSGGQILYSTPPAYGAAYGWELGPLAPLASTSVTITAQLIAPPDCTNALRTNTAVVTWACGSPDGNPTTADYDCESNEWDSASDRVAMPNLSIAPSDITPIFSCSGDGIDPGAELEIVVHNTGDATIDTGDDFTLTVTETTTGYSVTDTFTNLGGTLPLAAGGSDTLTFPWAVACSSCDYTINVTLDVLDDICECDGTDNAAVLNETISLPDLIVDTADLAVTCAGDGQIRVQGPVTLRNDGCGDPLTGTVRILLSLFDGSDCAGNEIDTFTVDFTGLSMAANGGTQQRTVDVTRTLDTCDTCQVSIRIEADDNDAICECDGTNNNLCAGTFPIASPNLTVTDIDFSHVTCTSDSIGGVVRVAVENTGCGAAGSFDVRLETDGCLTFSNETVAGLAAAGSTTVDFAVTGTWTDCADCSCMFTATVDPADAICECDGTNNDLAEPFTSTLPDLEISGAIASIGCSVDGQATLDVDVTVDNTGCADVTEPFDLRVTIYEDANCTGAVVDMWTEAVNDDVSASGSAVISLTTHVLSQGLCADDCAYSARFEVDANDDVCECDGTDNEFCLTAIPSELPDLVVTEVDPSVDCQAGTASVTATVGNVGCGDATGVVFRLTSPGCGLSIDSAPLDLASGAAQDVIFNYTPDCADGSWNCTYTVTADPSAAICECDGANALTRDGYPGIGSIGDRVWFDFDGDGVQDGGEDGIPNVTLILEGDLDGDGSIDFVAEMATDANGEYLFEFLPAGDYTITVDDTTLPDGLAQTYDYDGLGTPHTSDYTLAENEHNREQDFGYRGTGSIGDYVWFDINGDGVQDPSESGIESVSVTLEGDVDGDGINEILTTTTDADGLYLFDYLPASPYTITVDDTTLPDGLAQTYDYDGLGSPHTSDYTLGAGEHNREQDFGYSTPALSVDKVIADILRGGASIGNITGPVEPGDVIVYEFVIENVGPVPAYDVGFDDALPPGVEIAAGAPGSYAVSTPSASGSLGLTGGETSFNAPIGATVNGGETLTATFTAVITSAVSQGDDLTNTAHAFGNREDGTPIPPENSVLGDTSDTDEEDPDADDTGIVTVGVLRPALSVDKTITDITRGGTSLGIAGPVEPGDTVFYRFVIRNVGGGTAHGVEFADTLPPGVVTETGTIVSDGTYGVSGSGASGSLGLADGVATFTTSIDATIPAGESLTADFAAEVTSGIVQGVALVNTAEATGEDGFGTEIPDENPDAGDTADDDEEDPDADDTGIAIIPTEEPALSVDKIITDIMRRGASIGPAGPVEPGDVVFYEYTIRNVGLGTAYAVDFTDTLPTGLVTEIDPPGIAGSYDVTDPSVVDAPLLGLTDGVSTFTTTIGAPIAGGGQLTADYTVLVTSDVRQGINLINVAAATGIDGAGNPIPGENADVGDTSDDDEEDPDADDTGITVVSPIVPALSIDKRVVDVLRGGTSVGVVDPVLYGDVIVYRTTIRNVGLGTAYAVEFTDTLPTGLEIETGAPADAGNYTVSGPAASGSMNLVDGVGSFTTSIDATIAGDETLTAIYMAVVTLTAPPALDLINVAEASGVDGAGTEIPDENADAGDTSDDDEEDPDADDTGIASVRVGAPALVTRKAVASIRLQGLTVDGDIVEPGDVVTYEVGVTNVGDGPAFRVDLFDELPPGFRYDGSTDATWPSGNSADDPIGAPGPLLTWLFGAALEAGEELVLRFDAFVTSDITQAATYTNTVTAVGEDGAGEEIPPDNSDVVPDDDDPDDTSDVSLIGAVPALVTDKSIVSVARAGRSLGAVETIESGDVITYGLLITNVGLGTVYDVDIRDILPEPFEYLVGSTFADWPFRAGTFTADPAGMPGPTLLWDTDATLGHNESIEMTFEASIAGPVRAGTAYTNELIATGRDGADERIQPNNADDVPEDNDPDDRDDVTVVAVEVVPALVTSKRVSDVIRDGRSTADRAVEEGDVVRYELTVRNVGPATAYHVGIDDRLPFEFDYVPGSTRAAWPRGSASGDPLPGAGGWIWDLDATLATDELLLLTFDALIVGPLFDGTVYTNRMHAFGEDASGQSIPEDQRDVVPGDDDPDDASDVSLVARSDTIQGEGGLIAVPILRKSAEVLGDGACERWSATADRLWFQTDIAMYAAAEFQLLEAVPADWELLPETLLPSWLRTMREEGARVARDNLFQVDGLSSIGIPLVNGPRVAQLAGQAGVPAETALASRLDDLADRAGLEPDKRPTGERWIFLEHAEGEPIYDTSIDGALGPAGDWTIVDKRIIASALGMGLLEQASAAQSLLASEPALDRYLGWVLVEVIANKLTSLDETLTVRDADERPYVPHVHREATADDPVVEDPDSHLFDQLSLLWGLARTVELIDELPNGVASHDAELWESMRQTAIKLIDEVLGAIEARHTAPSGSILGVSGDRGDTAATVDLGLLLAALDAARRTIPDDAARIDALFGSALDDLVGRQADNGLFAATTSGDASAFVELRTQLAGIRGLLIANGASGDAALVGRAQAAFDALDARLWIDRGGIGLYASARFDDTRATCYTPLEIGLAVGALRELALVSAAGRRALILNRLSGFVRSIVDEAALQLTNAVPAGANVTVGTGRGGIAPLVLENEDVRLAPVLQQRLCLEDASSDDPCGDWHTLDHEPWYRTDVSMYAAFVLQDRLAAFEDIADANLIAVVFHSGLGVPFREIASLGGAPDSLIDVSVEPIALPYASGSPRLASAGDLSWSASTFDERIVASAVGMTLLREAQEVRQFLDRHTTDPRRETKARLLVASIAQTLSALRDVRIEGPGGVEYVPHASLWDASHERLLMTEHESTLFDQASLVWGLSEAAALLTDARVVPLVETPDASEWAVELLESALGTLESAHLDPEALILVDESRPAGDAWALGRQVSTVNLGLTASALEHVIDAFGAASPPGSRALALLTRIEGFVRTEAWRGVGEVAEKLDLDGPDSAPCRPETLAGQLGALRVLVAALRHLDLEARIVADALRAIDSRLWDPDLLVYRGESERIEWCVTPLELGLVVDTVDRAVGTLPPQEAAATRGRLLRHVDRTLDALRLQLPSEREDGERFAPVFDRRICLRPIALLGEVGWAQPGDIIRYTVTAENTTDETFIDLVLDDALPEGVTLVEAEPVGAETGSGISWTFGELAPSEERTWQILARVNESAAFGDQLLNCAVLTYANLDREPQPPREACATTRIETLARGRAGLLSDVSIRYVTDEAMHLASVLDDLACHESSSWDLAGTAHELAVANLGTLLGASALGVPLASAPRLSDPGNPIPVEALSTLLSAFAARAGLPATPESIRRPILLPYEAGVPILEAGAGFLEREETITPAALGWTLVEEVLFLDGCGPSDSPLAGVLVELIAYTVDAQIEWLSAILLTSDDVDAYLPHGTRATILGEGTTYGVSDPRSTAYDQASLLLGLLHVAEGDALDRRTKLLAQQMASSVVDQLSLHWDDESAVLADELYGEVASEPAGWSDVSVVARALAAGAPILPGQRDRANEILDGLAHAALDRGRIRHRTDEAARLTVLLLATQSLGLTDATTGFTEGWHAYTDGAAAERSVVLARPDWTYTPGDLAIRLALLAEVARSIPEERETAFLAATEHIERDILAARVQLAEPRDLWLHHTRTPCFDLASVFAHLRGPIPDLP